MDHSFTSTSVDSTLDGDDDDTPMSRRSQIRRAECRRRWFVTGIIRTLLLVSCVAGSSIASERTRVGSAYKGFEVAALEINGLPRAQANALRSGLALSGKSGLLGAKRATFYPQILRDDLSRARLFLASRGYPRAEVNPRIDADPRKRTLRLTLDVAPGSPVIVETIRIDGGIEAAAELSAGLPIREQMVFSDLLIKHSEDEIVRRLRAAGHARAHVETSIEPIDSTRVSIRFHAAPGPVCYFGKKVIEGPSPDLLPLVGRSAEIDSGERFSPAGMRVAEENLRLLGLFRRVRVGAIDEGGDTLDVALDLIPRLAQSVEVGIGYWTDDQFRAHARWEHRNLFRAGRGMEIHASYSRYLREAGIGLQWLGLAGSRTTSLLNMRVRQENEENYELRGEEVEFAGRYRHSFRTSLVAAVTFSNVQIDLKTDEGADVEDEGLLTILSLTWLHDGSNDRLYPTSGIVGRVRTEWGPPGGLTESHFVRGETSHSLYLSLGGQVVVASRLGLGLATPTGESIELLPNKRFYAGGMTSMRGFSRRKLGPLDEDEAPLGGEAKIELATEIRFPIFWRFRGALFLDSGQVWEDRRTARVDQMELAAGPSLMVQTPIGPVRADLGLRLTDREKDQPMQAFHISIGHPF